MQIRQYNFEDMRKREYEIWTCVWRTLSLDMRFVIYPFRINAGEGFVCNGITSMLTYPRTRIEAC
jgi:hypothetical protein